MMNQSIRPAVAASTILGGVLGIAVLVVGGLALARNLHLLFTPPVVDRPVLVGWILHQALLGALLGGSVGVARALWLGRRRVQAGKVCVMGSLVVMMLVQAQTFIQIWSLSHQPPLLTYLASVSGSSWPAQYLIGSLLSLPMLAALVFFGCGLKMTRA